MENLFLEGTDTLPNVEMINKGTIKVEGRALPEDAIRFFQPILTWVTEFQGPHIHVNINLEYFNTSVSKQLYNFLKILNHKPDNIGVSVTWHYEDGDDDMLESGEIYHALFSRIKFNFNQFEEIME